MNQLYLPVLMMIAFGYPGLTSLILLTGGNASNFNLWLRVIEVALLAVLMLANARRFRTVNSALWPVILFLSIYAVRLLYDVLILDILMIFQTPLYAVGYFFGLTFLPILAIFLFFKAPDMRALARWLICVLAFTNVVLLIYAFSRGGQVGVGIFSGRIEEGGNIEGTALLGPLWFGLCGAGLGAVIVGYLAFSVRLANTLRATALVLFLICIANVFFSASRGPVIAFFAALLCLVVKLLIARRSGGPRKSVQVWLAIIGIVGCITWVAYSVEGDVFLFERFTKMFNDRQMGNLEVRDYIRMAAWNDFLSAPIFGRSYVVSFDNASAHNIALDSLVSTGLFGTMFLVLALWRTATSVWDLLGGMWGAEGVALGMITIVVSVLAMTSGSIGQSPDFWIFSALVIVAAASSKPQKLVINSTRGAMR